MVADLMVADLMAPDLIAPDIRLALPDGWEHIHTKNGVMTFSPDDEDSVLQFSSPAWVGEFRGVDAALLVPLLAEMVEEGGIGRVVASGVVDLPYGRAIRAEVLSEKYDDVLAWLVVPAINDILLITWIAGIGGYGESAIEIVDNLAPGMFSVAIASAVEIGGRALAAGELTSHAVLYGQGVITQLDLNSLPQDLWTELCRMERAHAGAEVIVQVLAATAPDGRDIALVYAESATRQRRLVIGDGPPIELDAERVDLFAAPDPELAAAFMAARKPSGSPDDAAG